VFLIRLRTYRACFYIFLVTSSIEYALLGIGWARVLSASKCNRLGRLLLVGRFLGCFVIAAFAICAIVIGSMTKGQQTLLLEIFLLLTQFFLCLARPVNMLTKYWLAAFGTGDHTTMSNGTTSMNVSKTISQATHGVGIAGPDSQKWDAKTIVTDAEMDSGSDRTRLSLKGMPSVPLPARIAKSIEGQGRISVDTRASSSDDIPADQLWLLVKANRAAKEAEAIEAGRRVLRDIQVRCYKRDCCK